MNPQHSLPEITAWQAQQLRLTAFPVDPEAAFPRDWWMEAIGEAAETSTRKKLIRTDEGRFGEIALTLTVDALRIDWSFFASIDPLNPPTSIPTIGTLPTVLGECSNLFNRFLTGLCPPLHRLAFGAVLEQPVDSREAGYSLLDTYLPDVKVSPESCDFNYRINRRRKANSIAVPLLINRLSTWSVMKWMVGVRLTGVGLQKDLPPAWSDACRLELDVNTDSELQGLLPQDSLIRIWEELVDLGKEIAARGDVP